MWGIHYTRRRNVSAHLTAHYESLDLTVIPDNYLPRTNYVRNCTPDEYRRRTPKVSWNAPGNSAPLRVTDYYRIINRGMVNSSNERTLATAIIPKGAAIIHTNSASAFRDVGKCMDFAALSVSVIIDFFVKTTGVPFIGVLAAHSYANTRR